MPKDFTFDEMTRLFAGLGFEIDNKGSTSGSRIALINKEKNLTYNMHRPHPDNTFKLYVMKLVMDFLLENELIEKEK